MGENNIIDTDGGALGVDKRDRMGRAENSVTEKSLCAVLAW